MRLTLDEYILYLIEYIHLEESIEEFLSSVPSDQMPSFTCLTSGRNHSMSLDDNPPDDVDDNDANSSSPHEIMDISLNTMSGGMRESLGASSPSTGFFPPDSSSSSTFNTKDHDVSQESSYDHHNNNYSSCHVAFCECSTGNHSSSHTRSQSALDVEYMMSSYGDPQNHLEPSTSTASPSGNQFVDHHHQANQSLQYYSVD